MTIRELFEHALCNGSEDKPLSVYCYEDGKLVNKEELEDDMLSDYSDEVIIGIDLPVETNKGELNMKLRHLTEEQKGAVIAVTQHYINMLYNNIIDNYGVEPFESWCEDGDIFDEDGREDCIKLMHKVAPLIDKLTYEYLNLGH